MNGRTRAEARKPLDAGNGLVCASLDAGGAWLSLGGAHSRLGFVELNALPPFDEAWRDDPAAVRRYRALMTESRHAFLALDADGWRRESSVRAPEGRRELEQRLVLRAEGAGRRPPVLRFRGRLDRPPLAEITEVSPLPPTGAATELRVLGRTLRIEAAALPAVAEVRVGGTGASWERTADGARIGLGPGSADELEVSVVCSLRETAP